VRTVTDRFLATLRIAHTVQTSVDLLPAGGGDPIALEVTGGDVSGDRTAAVRRTCRVTLPASTVPELPSFEELPCGSYLDVKRGIRYADGDSELVRLGMFRIDSVSSATPEGVATIAGSDRMQQIIDEKMIAPYDANGEKPTNAIVALVGEVFPDVDVTHDTDPIAEAALVDVVFATDRDRAIAELAASVGCEGYFDADGGFQLQYITDPAEGEIAWYVDAGENGVLVSYNDQLERGGVYNGVLVRGQSDAATPPITALVVDDDPMSPTFWTGPFGKVPLILESQAVQTFAQAELVATTELSRRLGLARNLTLRAVPNPALEPADVVQVVRADDSEERHIVDSIKIPLDVTSPIDIGTRSVWQPPTGLAALRTFAGREAYRQLRGARIAA
jgi:hypothetical protein